MPINTKRIHHKRAILLTLLLLVGLLAVPVMLMWRQVRQEQLNHSLLLAVRRNDTQAVLALLGQRADPNERELPSYTGSLWLDLLERYIHIIYVRSLSYFLNRIFFMNSTLLSERFHL